jgi:hypothetical protein
VTWLGALLQRRTAAPPRGSSPLVEQLRREMPLEVKRAGLKFVTWCKENGYSVDVRRAPRK